MKKTIPLSVICFLVMPLTVIFASEIIADSKVAGVMIYPDSVLVTRQAQVKLNPGSNKVIFADIIPEVDENSLKVSLNENSGAKLLSAQVKQEYLEQIPSEQIQKLKDQIQVVEDDLRREQNLRGLLGEEKNYLDSIRFFSQGQLPKDLVTKTPTPAELDAMLKFLDAKLKENYAAVMEADLKTRELTNKLQALRMEFSKIAGGVQKLKRSVEVELDAAKGQAAMVSISFLVRGASWQPLYDARANFEKSEVELISYANVKQNTGDDWKDVDLALSTARPSVGGNMPYVEPWFLRPFQPRVLREQKSGFMGKMKMASEIGSQYEAYSDSANVAMPAAAPQVAYATPQEKGIAVVYTISHKVSIKPDGTDNKLPVSTQMLKADFEYSAYPRAAATAFLGSRVVNAKDLQLLSARVNVFLEGDFVGTSSIPNIGPGEEFDLYLGADENVKVKRELLEKKVDETLIANIASPNRKTNFKYKITVENYKSRKIKVKLFEAMPIPQDDRIKAKIEKVSLEPKIKDWKDRKGVWLWDLELNPGQKQEITYSFTVDHPRDMQVEGL
ncbi:MAG: mucoidy inhibitor MuiA family protein [Candidatus Omnitrophica bacterium]|nr:mucoidy inhibitor MuiA family protein [Candidatus Omnitrophota bacterium]